MAMITRMLVEDFLGGDVPPYSELINGEVVVHDPNFRHQETLGDLFFLLKQWALALPDRGRAGLGGNWIFGPATSLIPDAWWVPTEQAPSLMGIRSDLPPALVIEVRSPSTWIRDAGVKLRIYEEGGVQEVWLVDNIANIIGVYRRSSPTSATFDVAFDITTGLLTSPLLNDFALDVDALFAAPAWSA
jgi:Uma2 family endonuclease